MSIDTNIRIGRDSVTQLSGQKQEPSWMLDIRLKGFEAYENGKLPALEKTKIDKWNYDQFNTFTEENSVNSLDELPADLKSLAAESEADRSFLVQKNSSVIFQQLAQSLKDKGVIFTDMDTAVREYPELVKKYFMTKAVKPDENKIVGLHAALWSGGAFVYVPKNVEVHLPLQAVYWIASARTGMFPHVLIVAEDNSSITYVDNYVSEKQDVSSVHNGVVEVIVGQGAKVRFATLHHFSADVTDYSLRRASVDRDGRMEWLLGELSTGDAVSENATLLEGTGSSAYSQSVAIGTGEQKLNFTSRMQHIGTHTESDILQRGVMKDSATAIFNGITKIEKGAEKSNGVQAENILMLDERARGDANPILLIDENDVKAGHAASVGRVDELQMFYLMSRGLTKAQAQSLIIRGFLAPVVDSIPIEGLHDRLKQVVERKMQS